MSLTARRVCFLLKGFQQTCTLCAQNIAENGKQTRPTQCSTIYR